LVDQADVELPKQEGNDDNYEKKDDLEKTTVTDTTSKNKKEQSKI